MAVMIYDKTFEEALEAVNNGHLVKHRDNISRLSSLFHMLALAVAMYGMDFNSNLRNHLKHWTIIKKPTDKERKK